MSSRTSPGRTRARHELLLVRHGESELNATRALVGRSDPPLTAPGREQARRSAAAIAADVVGTGSCRLLSSPLRRALDTAELIAAELAAGGHVISVEVEERLIELDYGDFDGMRPDDLPKDAWSAWRDDPGFRPPGGETLLELQERCSALYDELRMTSVGTGRSAGSSLIAVSHVSPIKAAVAWALGTGPEISWRLHLPLASLTRVSLGPAVPALLSFGETCHLTRPDPAEGRVGH